jgi:hypothetical protein
MQLGGDGISLILHANATQVQRVIHSSASSIYPLFPNDLGNAIQVAGRVFKK